MARRLRSATVIVATVIWGAAALCGQEAPKWSWKGPATWHLQGSSSPPLGGELMGIAPNPNVPGGAWVAGMGGVWGYTPSAWTPTALARPVTALALAPDGTLLAGTETGLLRQAAGEWSEQSSAPFDGHLVRQLAIQADGTILAMTSAGIYASSDNGLTWTPSRLLAALPLPSWKAVAVCANPAGGSYVLTAEPTALFAVSANGQTITSVPLPTQFHDSAQAVAVAADAAGLWLGGSSSAGGASLWNSTNGGQSWAPVPLFAGTPDVHAIALNPSGPGGWVATDTGLYSLSGQDLNRGLTNFAATSLQLSPTGISAALSPRMVAGGSYVDQDWTVADSQSAWSAMADCRTSGGSEWALDVAGKLWEWMAGSWVASRDPSAYAALACAGTKAWQVATPATAIAAVSDQVAYRADGTALRYTADGGATWTPLATLPAPMTAIARNPVHSDMLAVALQGGNVSVSQDSGRTWVAVGATPGTALPGAPVSALAFDSGENLWAATLGRGIWMMPLANAARELTLSGLPSAPVAPGTKIALTATYTAMGMPVPDFSVGFSFSQGARSVGTVDAVTDANGVASATYTAPTQAGALAVLASVGSGGGDLLQARGQFTVAPGGPTIIEVISGANQAQINGQMLLQPIVLKVTDAYANPVPKVAITLSADAGQFSADSLTTASDGTANVNFTLPTGLSTGKQTLALTAIAAGLSTSWKETALPTPDFSLTLSPPAVPPVPNTQVDLNYAVNALNGWMDPVTVTCTAQTSAGPLPGCAAAGGQVAFDSGGASAVTVVITGRSGVLVRTASVDVAVQSIKLNLGDGSNSITLSLARGQSRQLPLQVIPLNQATGIVTLAVQQQPNTLPAGMTLSFTPTSTVELPGKAKDGAAEAAVSVVLASDAATGTTSVPWPLWPMCMAMLALALQSRRRLPRRRRATLGAALGLTLALSACGGAPAGARVAPSAVPPPPPPAPAVVPYSVNVIATCVAPGGTIQASAQFTINVTQ